MIVGVGSWRGQGASTTALLLAAGLASRPVSRPASGSYTVWLVEADPAGGTLAARLELPLDEVGGLERLAFPTNRAAVDDRFADAAGRLGGVRVITAPGDPFRAWACHTPRIAWVPLLAELDGPVVVDLGRLRGGLPHTALLAQLDVVLMTATPDPVSLVSTLEWAEARGRVAPADSGLPLDLTRVVVVDAPSTRRRVTRAAVEIELGDRYAGWLPWRPECVELVERGAALSDRRIRRDALAQAGAQLAEHVAHLADRAEAV